jgi:uncharacterized protein
VSEPVFGDSSGFFAAFAENDIHHRAAVHALAPECTLITTRLVVFETISLITKRLSPFYARAWFQGLLKDKHVSIHEIEQPLLRDAERFWLKHRDKSWDLIDCYSFTVMRRNKISRAFTLDQHFRQAGFATLLNT